MLFTSGTLIFFHSTIIPKLKSQNLALYSYHPPTFSTSCRKHHLARKLSEPTLNHVKGDTLSLSVAESDAIFCSLSSNDLKIEPKEYHPFVPGQLAVLRKSRRDGVSNHHFFSNSGGFSIGISMHHAALDVKTRFLFLKSWAHIYEHVHQSDGILLPDQPKPSYDRSLIRHPIGLQLEAIYLNEFLNMNGRQNNLSLMVAARYIYIISSDIKVISRSTQVVRKNRTGEITFSDGKNGGGAVGIALVMEKHHMDYGGFCFSIC
ncbi:hypothetical protein C1H46_019046 [Malus baccata]|uniref:Transferase n=1 Tax=Malus baccata TaxID=106549 RepID=A0A540M931_MALBA|nr:hypothetical protein C1H46_019046 [Malus baccata]